MNTFDSYTHHLMEEQEANPDKFLGLLAWYSVPESVWVNFHTYTKLAIELEAPVSISKPPKPADVFLRACTTVEKQFQKQPTGNDTYVNWNIRKAGSDNNWVCKQIVAEYVDADDHELDYSVAADLWFHKTTFEFKVTIKGSTDGEEEGFVNSIVEAIKHYYKDKEMLLNAYAIRESFRRAMEGPLSAISVRPAGGLYFVSTSHGRQLARLEMLVNEIAGVTLHTLPLVDDEKQREMIREAFEADAVGEMEKLIGDIQEVIEKKGKLTPAQLVAFQERYDDLRGRKKEYSAILEDSLDKANATLQVTKMTIQSAFDKVAE